LNYISGFFLLSNAFCDFWDFYISALLFSKLSKGNTFFFSLFSIYFDDFFGGVFFEKIYFGIVEFSRGLSFSTVRA
jgi:hypothetical protein